MGDLLFYLLKSGCYLIIFYLLFKLLMSGTTFFRFNRVTILAGIIGCMFLPLIEFTTQEETFLTVPLQTIQGIFVEQADGIFWDTMFWVRPQVDETGNMQAINWCPIALGYVYLAGGLFVLCRILLSFSITISQLPFLILIFESLPFSTLSASLLMSSKVRLQAIIFSLI